MGIFSTQNLGITLDDSGNQGLFVMAGFAAKANQWAQFDIAWSAVLDDFGVAKHHMADFAAKARPFDNWDQEKRRLYLQGLARAISSADLRGICAPIDIAALGRANAKKGLSFGAYSVAAAVVAMEFNNYYGDQQGELRFDRGNEKRKELDSAGLILDSHGNYRQWWSEEHVSWRHLTKSEKAMNIRGIEAADFAAWEIRSHKGWIPGTTRAAPVNGRIHSDAELQDMLRHAPRMEAVREESPPGIKLTD